MRGAAALALAGLIIKVSNLVVRIPLARLLDSEGLGIFMMAMPAFNAVFHVAAGGVPVAVQNLVAEYTSQGRPLVAEQVRRLGLSYTMVVGGAAAVLLMGGAPVLADLLGEKRAAWSLMAVAPAVLLFATDSIYRNYLQGRKLMTPSATGSILEQLTKIVVTLAAAYAFMPRGKEMGAAGATLGMSAGAAVSLLYMAYVCRRIQQEDRLSGFERPESRVVLIRRMIQQAWPVTVGYVTMPLLGLLDVGIVQRGFQRAGYSVGEATAMYGAYSGIAVQVVWFPFVLTNALANTLAPILSAAAARKDYKTVRERSLLGLRATGLVCLPVAVGVAILAGPIARLFGDPRAAAPLVVMAPVAYLGPLAWLMITQLQSLGRTGPPMRNQAIAWILKIGLDVLLAPVYGIDVKGVAAASVVMFLVTCWLNARELQKALEMPLPWSLLLRGPLAASLVMGAAVFGITASRILPDTSWMTVCAAILLAPIIYVATLLATHAITRAEVAGMGGPLGPRFERWLHLLWPWS